MRVREQRQGQGRVVAAAGPRPGWSRERSAALPQALNDQAELRAWTKGYKDFKQGGQLTNTKSMTNEVTFHN